jgi:hypothetical protein
MRKLLTLLIGVVASFTPGQVVAFISNAAP